MGIGEKGEKIRECLQISLLVTSGGVTEKHNLTWPKRQCVKIPSLQQKEDCIHSSNICLFSGAFGGHFSILPLSC